LQKVIGSGQHGGFCDDDKAGIGRPRRVLTLKVLPIAGRSYRDHPYRPCHRPLAPSDQQDIRRRHHRPRLQIGHHDRRPSATAICIEPQGPVSGAEDEAVIGGRRPNAGRVSRELAAMGQDIREKGYVTLPAITGELKRRGILLAETGFHRSDSSPEINAAAQRASPVRDHPELDAAVVGLALGRVVGTDRF
jgi:hypothetical protein